MASNNHSLLLLFFFLHILLYLTKLLELVNRLICYLGVLIDLLVVHQLVHIVWRHWTNYVFMLFVVPNFLVLFKSTLVQLIKKREGSWLIVFLFFFSFFFLLNLSNEYNLFCFRIFLFSFLGFDVDIIGFVKELFIIFRFLRIAWK